MPREYPQVSLTPLEIDRILFYLRPHDDGSHLKKKLLAAKDRYEELKARATDKRRKEVRG